MWPSPLGLSLYNAFKKVITNLDLSQAFGLDGIPVVVPKKCETELSYVLAELINICLKKSFFPDCGKVSFVVAVFKNVGERSKAKHCCLLVFSLCLLKSFKNFIN